VKIGGRFPTTGGRSEEAFSDDGTIVFCEDLEVSDDEVRSLGRRSEEAIYDVGRRHFL